MMKRVDGKGCIYREPPYKPPRAASHRSSGPLTPSKVIQTYTGRRDTRLDRGAVPNTWLCQRLNAPIEL